MTVEQVKPDAASKVRTLRIGRSRLRRIGARGADSLTIAGWVCGGAFAVSVAVWAWAWLRPLEQDQSEGVIEHPPTVALLERDGGVDARKSRIAGMGTGNIFSLGRKKWPSANPDDQAVAGGQPKAPVTPILDGSGVPADIQPALDNLTLQAVFESHGAKRAMIGFVNDPKGSIGVGENEEFTDKSFPQASWRLLSIDMTGKRAVLLRAGSRFSLAMFKNAPQIAKAKDDKPAAGPAGAPPAVTQISRADAIKALRDAHISEAEIQQLMALVDANGKPAPIDASGKATAEAMKKVIGDGSTPDSPAAPPAGLESVLKLMASGKPPEGLTVPGKPAKPNQPQQQPASQPANPSQPPPAPAPASQPPAQTPPASTSPPK